MCQHTHWEKVVRRDCEPLGHFEMELRCRGCGARKFIVPVLEPGPGITFTHCEDCYIGREHECTFIPACHWHLVPRRRPTLEGALAVMEFTHLFNLLSL